MAAALDFSGQLTGLSPSAAKEGRELLASLGLPVRPPKLPRDEILGALKVDKKKQGARLVFVLLRRLGEAVIHPEVPLPMIEAWLDQNSLARE
jgi:3-dehydroquinate synthase